MTVIQNRLTRLFQNKKENLLAIYFTAGYPRKEDTLPILEAIEQAGADIVEIGIPYSDPIADGPTIQASNQQALENGMHLRLLLDQIKDLRKHVQVPVLLMGYLNPVVQFGIERFCEQIAAIGVDGLILPDLPMHEYQQEYKQLFDQHQLSNIFLITPETSEARIRTIDAYSQGFIYMVSSSSTTGKTSNISEHQEAYFQRIQAMNLQNPKLIGFGIHDRVSFQKACQYAQGAIIGSAFIKNLSQYQADNQAIKQFVKGIIEPV